MASSTPWAKAVEQHNDVRKRMIWDNEGFILKKDYLRHAKIVLFGLTMIRFMILVSSTATAAAATTTAAAAAAAVTAAAVATAASAVTAAATATAA